MTRWWTRVLAAAGVAVMCVLPVPARAQANRGRLMVTVTDATGAVLPNATVTIVGLETATRAATLAPVQADTSGIATIPNLTPGRYSVQAVFPAFDTTLLREVRVRAGDNRQTIVLRLSSLSDSVTVGRDQQESASDRSSTFGTALTREQIEALSDDETEMAAQIRAMAGPDAVIRVDSFEGQQLPPKSQIKSIRITRDQFAAENHYAGGISVEIITQPGIGPLRTNIRTGFYDSALDGENALTGQTTPTHYRNYGGGLTGTLIQNKSSFSINFNGLNQLAIPVAYGWAGDQQVAGTMPVRQPSQQFGVNGSIDYAVTKDQTLRAGFSRNVRSSDNLGLGGLNFDPRGGYRNENSGWQFRVQETGPLGRRFFSSSRLLLGYNRTENTSAVELPTVTVLGSSTTGGAQQAGASRTRNLLLGSDLDYIRGRHSVRMGVQVDGTGYRTDQRTNYLGTYTFVSPEAFAAGTPRSYTQRVGDPNIEYWNLQTGLYIQDDIKVRKNLTLTPGLRYEVQTHVHDATNFGPRFGITWAPLKSGSMTLRGSAGVFYDWLGTYVYEQTLRVDGFHQLEVNIVNPSYPIDPAEVANGPTIPTNRYLLGDDVRLARTTRYSAGISQTLFKRWSMGATYYESRGSGVLVGNNLNAPVDGVRPDPQFANIIQATSGGRSEQRGVSFNTGVGLQRNTTGPPAAGGSRLFDWRRGLSINGYYSFGRFNNNTDGAFAVPATGNLAFEWGPAPGDVRHRGQIYLGTAALRSLNAQINVNMSSAPAITLQTGTDDNGDLIFNDRPAGVSRYSHRTTGQWSADAYINYSFGLGRQQMVQGQGVMITSNGGVLSASAMAAQSAPRYRLNVSCQINNLTNHANYVGYSGVQTSSGYLQPTSIQAVRRITFNIGLQF